MTLHCLLKISIKEQELSKVPGVLRTKAVDKDVAKTENKI